MRFYISVGGAFALAFALACTSSTGPGEGAEDALIPREPLELRDTIPLGSRPYGVALAGTTALVTQLDASQVQRFTIPSRQPVTIAVGNIPTGIAISRAGTTALVTNQHDPSVGIIAVAQASQHRSLPSSGTTLRAVISRNGRRGYATSSDGKAYAIDLESGDLVDSGTTVTAANGLALAGDTLLVITSMFGEGISWMDARTMQEIRRTSESGTFQDVVLRPSANLGYFALENRAVIQIRRLDTGALVDSILVPHPTFGLARRPFSTELWAAHAGSGVSVIDLRTNSVTRTLSVADPRRIAFDAEGKQGVLSSQQGAVYFLRP